MTSQTSTSQDCALRHGETDRRARKTEFKTGSTQTSTAQITARPKPTAKVQPTRLEARVLEEEREEDEGDGEEVEEEEEEEEMPTTPARIFLQARPTRSEATVLVEQALEQQEEEGEWMPTTAARRFPSSRH